MNIDIYQLKFYINENNSLSVLLYEHVRKVLTPLKIQFSKIESHNETFFVSVIDKTAISKEKIFHIDDEIYFMKKVERDLYLFIILAEVLKYIHPDIFTYWIESLMQKEIYFHTLFLMLSRSIPMLQNQNSTLNVIEKILKVSILKPNLFRKIHLNIDIKYMEVELGKDLYDTVNFELGDKIDVLHSKHNIPIITYKINNNHTKHLLLSINGYRVYQDIIHLDKFPAESVFGSIKHQEYFNIHWFSKEKNSIKKLLKKGYIVYDYMTLIQKIQQQIFHTVDLSQVKEKYTSYHIAENMCMNDTDTPSTISKKDFEVSNRFHIKATSLSKRRNSTDSLTPSIIEKKLHNTVAGQKTAKKELASIFYWHKLSTQIHDIESLNSSVLLAGSTGSGKTFMIQQLANITNLIFVHVDASQLVPEGYRGRSINDVIKEILLKSDYNLEKAESCIIFFDECDKLNSKNEYDRSVINQLLRFTEGASFSISIDFHREQEEFENISSISSHSMLKIFAGSFYHQLKSTQSNVGFLNTQTATLTKEVLSEAFPPEFNGRISRKIILEKIGYEEIYNLLKFKNNEIRKIVKKIEYFGHSVSIDDSVYRKIAKDVEYNLIGMRRIKHLVMELFLPLLSIAPEIKPTTFMLSEDDVNRAITKII